MKVWTLIPLVIFIAIAGYQFGYYHAKMDISDAKKALLADNESIKPNRVIADKVVLKAAAAEIPPATQEVLETKKYQNKQESVVIEDVAPTQGTIAKLDEVSRDYSKRAQALDEFVENYDDSDQDMEIATRITDFFALHPDGQKVYFHHVRCDTLQCQLVGQFEGHHELFEEILSEMMQQDWYSFGGTSSNINSDASETHFVIHLTDRKASS